MAYCGEHTLVNEKSDGWEAISLKCKSWLCPTCHEDRRRQLIALAFAGKPNRFITLTVSPHVGVGPLERAYELSRSWRNIVKCLKRKYPGQSLQYLCVFEKQKSGEPHLHILWRGPWVDQAWLSSQMQSRMGAPICDVRSVTKRKEIAGYVAKYIGKASQKFGNLKRYWKSKAYDLSESMDGWNKAGPADNWQIWKFTLRECVGMWTHQGYDVEFDGHRAAFDRNVCHNERCSTGRDRPDRFSADVSLWEKYLQRPAHA